MTEGQAPAAPAAPAAAPAAPAQQAQAPQPVPMPAHLTPGGGKYKTVDDLAKGYDELSQLLGQRGQPQQQQQGVIPPPPQGPQGLEAAHVELLQTGKISPETRKAHGISDDLANWAEQAVVAQGELYKNQVLTEAGGVEEFVAMRNWASANLSNEERDQFNKLVDSGNIEMVAPAVKGLMARFKQATTEPGSQVSGGVVPQQARPFASRAEMEAAMADPRYGLGGETGVDPAYFQEIQARTIASLQAGTIR